MSDAPPLSAAALPTGSSAVPLRPVDRAYESIRDAILTGRLRPGDLLAEEPLAALSGTSRTPVREALRRLVVEGLATVVDRHRFVAELDFDEVAVMFDLRAQLEGYAAGLAARRITGAELDRLRHLIEAIEALPPTAPQDAAGDFLRLNGDFHAVVLKAARSTQLHRLVAPVAAVPLALLKQFMLDQPLDMRRSNAEHRAIVAALAARDCAAASAAMSGHILATKPRPPEPPRRGR